MHNLPGFETTMVEQVGQSLFTRVGQQRLENFPDFAAIGQIFHFWLSRFSWQGQRDFFWTRVGPQRIQNSPLQTRTQVDQCPGKRFEYYLLSGRCPPESFKGHCHIVFFALPAISNLSVGMATQPTPHDLAQALLYPGPGSLIALHYRTV